jgi:DNA polymerase III epsilon subunit-like protein
VANHSESTGEVLIVVDVEAAGPNPSQYALLSIGACTLDEPRQTFYVELVPDKSAFRAEALQVNRLSLDRLAAEGETPARALAAFAAWLDQVVPSGARPIFTAFNAAFDWMFVNDYFHRYLGHNPFGHSALDLKAFCMGKLGLSWSETSYRAVCTRYGRCPELQHSALADAMATTELLEAVLRE